MLLGLGSNGNGQLGIGDFDDTFKPKPCLFSSQHNGFPSTTIPGEVLQVSCGGNHTLVLLHDGSLYTSGSNTEGQCGWDQTQLKKTHSFLLHTTLRNVISIACGWAHSIVVESLPSTTNSHSVYAFGSNQYGQLGILNTLKNVFIPTLLNVPCQGDLHVAKVSCGMRHSALVTERGELFLWGQARHGQLGLGQQCSKVLTPARVNLKTKVVDVQCGAQHTLILTDEGDIWACGSNKYRQIDEQDQTPSFIAFHKVSFNCVSPLFSFSSGWHHNVACFKNGEVVFWGRRDHGQLGGAIPMVAYQRLGNNIVVAGSEHCVAVDSKGQVQCFGWNEHGNCGEGVVQSSTVQQQQDEVMAIINTDIKVGKAFAGCATTFLLKK